MKKLLVFGLLLLPYSNAYSGPKFNPITGQLEEVCDSNCQMAKLNAKPKDRLGREIVSSPTLVSSGEVQRIVIKDLDHSHLGTIGELTEIDLKSNKLDSLQLKAIKSELRTFLSGVEFPDHLSAMGDKFRADTTRDLENMTQAQLIASMLGIADVAKILGQEDLHAGTGYFLRGLAPEVSQYLQNHEGFVTDRNPMISIQINAQSIRNAFQKMNEGGALNSHASGISLYSRGGASGQWSEDDRAHAIVVNAFKRGLEFGGAGASIGAGMGSIVPGLGTGAGAATGATLGATGGAIWGAIEGNRHPELGGAAPSGVKKTTEVVNSSKEESVKDEKTGKITTTLTEIKTTKVTKENLETGEVTSETIVVETPTVTETCGGKKCEGDGEKPKGDASCEDPYDIDNRNVPLTPEQAAAEKIRFKQQADLIKGSLILLTEPRYQVEADAGRLMEIAKEKKDSLINPGFESDSETAIPKAPFVKFNPLFDPQRDMMKVRSGK